MENTFLKKTLNLITCTFDYSLEKWKTSRNKLWVGSTYVKKVSYNPSIERLPHKGDVTVMQDGTIVKAVYIDDVAYQNAITNHDETHANDMEALGLLSGVAVLVILCLTILNLK